MRSALSWFEKYSSRSFPSYTGFGLSSRFARTKTTNHGFTAGVGAAVETGTAEAVELLLPEPVLAAACWLSETGCCGSVPASVGLVRMVVTNRIAAKTAILLERGRCNMRFSFSRPLL
jgi:hypothetical protein